MSDVARPPSRLRRLMQFSLRALFVLVGVCSICLGLAFHRAREQAHAVAAIASAGGHVFYDYHGTEPDDLDQAAKSEFPAWLLEALGVDFFHTATVVAFHRIDTTDDELAAVAALSDVRILAVAGRITDDGLKHLLHLKQLRLLDILSGEITDQGLANLQNLMHLKTLGIRGPSELDFFFSENPPDPTTSLYGVNVTDRGLEVLKALPALREVRLDNTKVTRTGAQALSDSLPDCIILVNQGCEEVFYVEPHPPPPGW